MKIIEMSLPFDTKIKINLFGNTIQILDFELIEGIEYSIKEEGRMFCMATRNYPSISKTMYPKTINFRYLTDNDKNYAQTVNINIREQKEEFFLGKNETYYGPLVTENFKFFVFVAKENQIHLQDVVEQAQYGVPMNVLNHIPLISIDDFVDDVQNILKAQLHDFD